MAVIGNAPFQGLVSGGNIIDASIEGVDLSTSAIAARLGYTPVDPGAAAIIGGTINGTTIGATTAAAGSFTTLSVSGAVTLNGGTASSLTLTSPKINEILDTSGNEIIGLSATASATDFLTVKNGIGVAVPLHVYADGPSTNIGLHIQPKGSGLVTISDGTDFNKGIRFRSSGSAASVVTLLDAVSTAGRVVTLPDATTTLVGRDTTDTLTNKTLTSPTLTAPVLGTPTSGNFSTGTFTWPTFNQNTTGTAAGLSATLATASGGTGLTTFTSGGVVYASSTSALATGSGLTFNGADLTVANGDLTIGTNGKKLFVNYIANNSGTDLYIGSGNTIFSTAGSEAMRLTSSSLYTATGINVGIGTSNPTSKLTIGTGTYSLAASGTTGMYTTATGLEMLSDSYFFGSRAGGTLMNLNSAGNLGVGNSVQANVNYQFGTNLVDSFGTIPDCTIGRRLGVTGTTYNSPVISLGYYSSAYGMDLWVGTTGLAPCYIDVRQNENLIFRNNTYTGTARETMRISSAGGLSIGSTVNPGAGNILLPGTSGTIFANDTTNSRSYIELYNTSTGDMSLATTYTTASIRFLTGGTTTPTERLRITSTGLVALGNPNNTTANAWSGAYAYQAGNSANFYGDGIQYNWVAGISLNTHRSGNVWYNTSASIPTGRFEIGNGALSSVGGFGWFWGSGGTAGAGAALNQMMTLDTSGRLLIGTTTADVGGSADGTVIRPTTGIATAISTTDFYSYTIYADRRGTNNAGKILAMGLGGYLKASIGVVGTNAVTNDGGITFNTIYNNDTQVHQMRIDANGVSISNSNSVPEVKLEVNGGADGSVVFGGRSDGGNGNNRRFNLVAFADGGGANYGGGLKIQTRNSVNVFADSVTIDSVGNLSVNNPAGSRFVQLQPDGSIRSVHSNGGGGDSLFGAIYGVSNGYQISVTTGNAQTYKWFNGGTQSMTLNPNGLLAIGTSQVNTGLSVWKANAVTGYTIGNMTGTMNVLDYTTPSAIGVGGRIVFAATYFTQGNTMGTGYIGTYKEYAPDNSGSEYNHSLTFGVVSSTYTNGREVGRFNSSGNFGIGTASPLGKLEVAAGADNQHIRIGDNNHDASSSTFRYPALSYYARRDNSRYNGAPLSDYGSTASVVFTDRPGTSGYPTNCRTSDIEFWTATNTGGTGLDTRPTRRLSITAEGVVDLPFGHIKFPATQNASGDANTLDDYEEGVWFPAWGSSGTTPTNTPSSTEGRYVKIGKVVHFWARIYMSYWGSDGTGSIRMTGLPFPSQDILASSALCHVIYTRSGGNTVWPTGATQIIGRIPGGVNYIEYVSLGGNTDNLGEVTGVSWASNPAMFNNFVTGSYLTTA